MLIARFERGALEPRRPPEASAKRGDEGSEAGERRSRLE
jgi:hypothetical protein